MRLILCNQHLDVKQVPGLASDTFVFICFEDFSVGPLSDWDDPLKFRQARTAYWAKTSWLDLPDGQKMDYFAWHQILPRHNMLDYVECAKEDWPKIYDFDDLIPRADTIEVWADSSAGDCLWRWYLAAELSRIGIDLERVAQCTFPGVFYDQSDPGFWNRMLCDAPNRDIHAIPQSQTEHQRMLKYWQAVVDLPAHIEPRFLQGADTPTLRAFEILAGRIPDTTTGLNNLQARLLWALRPDWTKMARVVGDTMAAGWDAGDRVSDLVLQAELEAMARMSPPPVEVEGSGAMRFCQVRLTNHGSEVRSHAERH